MNPAPRPFDLHDRKAIVTGASAGLGFAMARGLAEAGATVVLNGRSQARLEAAVQQLREDGLDVHAEAFDVSDSAAVSTGVAAVLERFGTVDILVNNAGIQHRQPIEDFTDADWHRVLATNLDAPFFMARALIPQMKMRGSGRIINICSLASTLARPTIVPYQVSKGGLAMLTRGLAVELAPHGIQVNGIAPGFFRTEMNVALTDDPRFNAWVEQRTPAARWAEPAELAGVAVFLASPASSFVTGQILYVDGGFTASM